MVVFVVVVEEEDRVIDVVVDCGFADVVVRVVLVIFDGLGGSPKDVEGCVGRGVG